MNSKNFRVAFEEVVNVQKPSIRGAEVSGRGGIYTLKFKAEMSLDWVERVIEKQYPDKYFEVEAE